MLYIGIDVGGTGIKGGVITEKGEILAKHSIPTGAGRPYEEVISDIANLCFLVIGKAGVSIRDIQSIGVGVPGICDPATGIIPFCTNLGWHNVPFISEIHKHIDLPVHVDNDATVAGLAESVAGVSAGSKSSIFITLGTGIGGGIVINGRPYSGIHGVGSEIGHMVIHKGGELCTCGNRGCFERYSSATAIIREARKALPDHPESLIAERCHGNPEEIDARIVFDSAKDGDTTACSIVNDYVQSLAIGIVNLINIMDPEIIVLGGGVAAAGDFLLNSVREAVKPLIFYKDMPYASIELARLGSDAGIIGAALLGLHR